MRPGRWGNPFKIGRDGNRDEVIRKHREKVRNDPRLQEVIRRELKGKILVCCCKPKACHCDTLAFVADGGKL
jgi:hypothetical protein